MAKVKGKTKNGFEFEIDPEMLDDMEFIEDVAAIQKGNLWKLPDVMDKIFGVEQKEALYASIKAEDGRVPTAAVTDMLEEIFEAALGETEAKNS